MRADRLVAILLMLQRRGQVTCAEVAAELEISERTARRDLDALSMAGVPVYSQQGRGGGWRLAGGGRLDLSGLSAPEARALFLVAGPSASATPEVRSALRKLLGALPEPMRLRAEAAADAVVVDRSSWDNPQRDLPAPPWLADVEAAVVEGECVRLGYQGRGADPTERVVHPLGLAIKAHVWYLVADTDAGLRTFRVDRVTSVARTGDPVERPDGFELSAAWASVTERVDRLRTPVVVHATAMTEALPHLRTVFGTRLAVVTAVPPGGAGADGEPGALDIELRGASVRAIAAELAGFGSWVHVRSPDDLCTLLGEIGRELVAAYAPVP